MDPLTSDMKHLLPLLQTYIEQWRVSHDQLSPEDQAWVSLSLSLRCVFLMRQSTMSTLSRLKASPFVRIPDKCDEKDLQAAVKLVEKGSGFKGEGWIEETVVAKKPSKKDHTVYYSSSFYQENFVGKRMPPTCFVLSSPLAHYNYTGTVSVNNSEEPLVVSISTTGDIHKEFMSLLWTVRETLLVHIPMELVAIERLSAKKVSQYLEGFFREKYQRDRFGAVKLDLVRGKEFEGLLQQCEKRNPQMPKTMCVAVLTTRKGQTSEEAFFNNSTPRPSLFPSLRI